MSRSIASSVAPLKGIDGIQWLAYINNCRISIRNLPSEKGGRGLTDSGLIFALYNARLDERHVGCATAANHKPGNRDVSWAVFC